MWARSTNTPFDWWLVLICCERKIHWLQRTKLQALLFRAVSLLGFCYNIVYLHYIYMVLAQFVLKFSSFPSGLRKVFFSVKSTYDSSDDNGDSFSRIWKAKLPYKIKIFLWLIEQGAILTKDNTVRRRWPGNPSCCFCDNMESINHLCFHLSYSQSGLEYCC